jgi:hypothetical protein
MTLRISRWCFKLTFLISTSIKFLQVIQVSTASHNPYIDIVINLYMFRITFGEYYNVLCIYLFPNISQYESLLQLVNPALK